MRRQPMKTKKVKKKPGKQSIPSELHPNDTRFCNDVRQRWIYCDGECGKWFHWERTSFLGAYLYKSDCPPTPVDWLNEPGNSTAKWQFMHWRCGYWDATWLCVSCLRAHHLKESGDRYTLNEILEWYGLAEQRRNELFRKRHRTGDGWFQDWMRSQSK